MPLDFGQTHIPDGAAVNMNIVILRKALNQLGDTAFRAVPFVERRRYDRDARLFGHYAYGCAGDPDGKASVGNLNKIPISNHR